MKIEASKQPLLDLEWRGVHVSAVPLDLFVELTQEGVDIQSRADTMATLFETGALCDKNGDRFEDFDFDADVMRDVRDFRELLSKLVDVAVTLGNSSGDAEAS